VNLTIRILGAEVLAITTETTSDDERGDERGDCTTYPVGFMSPTVLPIRETERDYE